MIPKYLYHYTSIDTVKKILQSRKIRFSRLDLLNDPYEGKFIIPEISLYQKEFSKLVYCSCWNADEAENVNLWHIYTGMNGVRIKIKSSMFAKEISLTEQKSGFVPLSLISSVDSDTVTANIELISSKISKTVEAKIDKVYGPIKISYVSNFGNTYDSVIGKSIANRGTESQFEMYDIDFKELGIKKVNHWEYEHEWRYKILPFIEVHGSKNVLLSAINIDAPNYIDIPFIEAIEEILLAPQVSDEDHNGLIQFVKSLNIDVPIRCSDIQYRRKK